MGAFAAGVLKPRARRRLDAAPRALRRCSASLAAAAWLAAATASSAQEGAAEAALGCEAEGYDVILTNLGEEVIPAETEVGWEVPFLRKAGTFKLTSEIQPGSRTFISGALGSDYLSSGVSCIAHPLDKTREREQGAVGAAGDPVEER